MSHHWTTRLARLQQKAASGAALRRAERRQLRKLLGRQQGRAWRSLGHQQVVRKEDGSLAVSIPRADALTMLIAEEAKTLGMIR